MQCRPKAVLEVLAADHYPRRNAALDQLAVARERFVLRRLAKPAAPLRRLHSRNAEIKVPDTSSAIFANPQLDS